MGGNQLELGHDSARSKANGITDTERAVPFTCTRGLGDGLDVFAGVAVGRLPPAARATTPSAPSGASMRTRPPPFSLALKPEILLPVSAAR